MRNTFATCITLLGLVHPLGLSANAEYAKVTGPHRIDVFTTEQKPIASVEEVIDQYPEMLVHVYTIDGIERLEEDLSRGLPADPEQAKRQALERLAHLPIEVSARLEWSAKGLVLALQWGIQQCPAVVFDQQQVVYGVTDLSSAVTYYHTWQTRDQP